jgi:hypothetical protein
MVTAVVRKTISRNIPDAITRFLTARGDAISTITRKNHADKTAEPVN